MAGSLRTSLWRTKVLAGSWSARTSATSLLDAQGAAFDDFALQTFFCSVGLFWSDHLDEAKATGFFCVWVQHDRAALDLTVLVEETRDIGL